MDMKIHTHTYSTVWHTHTHVQYTSIFLPIFCHMCNLQHIMQGLSLSPHFLLCSSFQNAYISTDQSIWEQIYCIRRLSLSPPVTLMGNNFPSTLRNSDKPLKNAMPLTVKIANPRGCLGGRRQPVTFSITVNILPMVDTYPKCLRVLRFSAVHPAALGFHCCH